MFGNKPKVVEEMETEEKKKIEFTEQINEQETISDAERIEKMLTKSEQDLFSEIYEELNDDTITDIEWDGDNLWYTQIGVGCYKVEKKLSFKFTENLAIRLSNIMKESFNVATPVLEAHTQKLRISIFHESRSGKKSFTIRKIPIVLRYTHEDLVNKGTLPEEMLCLLENLTIAHCNMFISGRPHAGKTELLKYLSCFIPANEKVVTLEDNAEIHYKEIHPDRKCTPLYIDEKFSYSDGIKACLRHNADWLLLSEARGIEVSELFNALSTGSYCMTTLHTDSVKDIPDRLFNMLADKNNDRFINNVYRYVDVGLVIKADKKENREVSEIGFFSRFNENNEYTQFYNSFNKTIKDPNLLPENIKRALKKVNIPIEEAYKRHEMPKIEEYKDYKPVISEV